MPLLAGLKLSERHKNGGEVSNVEQGSSQSSVKENNPALSRHAGCRRFGGLQMLLSAVLAVESSIPDIKLCGRNHPYEPDSLLQVIGELLAERIKIPALAAQSNRVG